LLINDRLINSFTKYGVEMKEMFTFENFPMAIIVALIAGSWLIFLSVIFSG